MMAARVTKPMKVDASLSYRVAMRRKCLMRLKKRSTRLGAAPRRADYAVQVLKVLLSWGHKRGLLDHNRAEGIGRLHHGDRRESIWTEGQIAAFKAVASEPLVRALVLALETGQRQADLLALTWDQIDGSIIRVRQKKTGVRVAIPILPELATCLDGLDRSRAHVLTRRTGEPWGESGNTFRSAWRDACAAAGVVGVTFHDLRGTFVTRRLAAGWTTQEVAMCTGHSLRDLSMLDTYADRDTIAQATATRLAGTGS